MKIELATPADSISLAAIAQACAPELPDNFTMRLGGAFHRAYYAALLAEPTTVAVCARASDEASGGASGGAVIGFAFGTLDSSAMMRAMKAARPRLALGAAAGLCRRPWLLAGLVKRALSLGGKSSGEGYVVTAGAKVSFLAVDPARRTAQAGPKLMKHAIAALRAAGAGAIQAEVDQSNPRVIRLHQRLGAAVTQEFVTPTGVPRVILEYPAAAAEPAVQRAA
ncbi:MAG: GNAT family N-acetyltransferase [Planctomycetota bacterium]